MIMKVCMDEMNGDDVFVWFLVISDIWVLVNSLDMIFLMDVSYACVCMYVGIDQ